MTINKYFINSLKIIFERPGNGMRSISNSKVFFSYFLLSGHLVNFDRNLHFVKSSSNISKDFINSTFSRDHAALSRVVLDDGFRVLVECNESLLDGFDIVVSSSGSLGSLEKSLGHGVIGDLKVEDVLAWSNGLLELLTLGNFTGISINEESLGTAELLDHGLGQEIKNGGKGNKLT